MNTSENIRGTQVSTPSDREVVITRVIDAPRGMVFDAWTNAEHLPNWMGPQEWTMSTCQIDLRPGGTYRLVWRGDNGTQMGISGTYREIARPQRLVSIESVDGWPEADAMLSLTEHDGQTMISNSIRYPSQEARDAALASGMAEGMSASFGRLEQYLRSMR